MTKISCHWLYRNINAWIRKGVEGEDDSFIKALTEDEKNELSLAVQEHQRLGE